ncbi:hypothetical protein E2562_031982 [Oryza meyeriana var. granulata]|uniref:Uncharacterized protein n=1 Tax=Oryza meyeriana var. granulata TaxID=110450 RepID=A0A6G1F077_9ORYZ|nr:hypothetical protein E2562_031982 [Oryza meyeriana var. granulata]
MTMDLKLHKRPSRHFLPADESARGEARGHLRRDDLFPPQLEKLKSPRLMVICDRFAASSRKIIPRLLAEDRKDHIHPKGSWDIMSSRKFESGNDKRKRKRRVDALIESQRGSLDKFFKSSTAASTNPDELAIVAVDEATNENEEENVDISVDDNNLGF